MEQKIPFFKPIQNSKGVTIVEILISAFIILLVVVFTRQAIVGSKETENIQGNGLIHYDRALSKLGGSGKGKVSTSGLEGIVTGEKAFKHK